MATVLIVDDTPSNLDVLRKYLGGSGIKVLVATSGENALEQIRLTEPDLVLLDVMMPGMDGFETCHRLKSSNPALPVIFMTALTGTDDKVRGFEASAVDYVTKPFQHEEVLARISAHLRIQKLQRELRRANEQLEQRVAERTDALSKANEELTALKSRLERENVYLQEEIKTEHNFEAIVGQSAGIKKVLKNVETVAPTNATVLIVSETGTGKELVARAIHNFSPKKDKALIKVNCAAIPSTLVDLLAMLELQWSKLPNQALDRTGQQVSRRRSTSNVRRYSAF